MKLNEMLAKFDDPLDAADVSMMGSYMASRWYQRGMKKIIPPIHVLYLWAEYFEISDEELGGLIRDAELERMRLAKRLEKSVGQVLQIERHRRALDAEVSSLETERELQVEVERAELSDLDKNKLEFLDKQRRVNALLEKQQRLLKELE